jgi:hypothetical protein
LQVVFFLNLAPAFADTDADGHKEWNPPYGLTDRLEIDGQLVYQQNFVKQGDLKAHSKGWCQD